MSRKRYTAEQIIGMLREVEVELSRDQKVGHICRSLGITEQTYYRWRQEYNTVRPHSSLRYWPPAPETIQPPPMPQIIPWIMSPQMKEENNRTLT